MNKLLNTYRIWNDQYESGEYYSSRIFKITDYDNEDNTYFCEHIYYEDSWSFDSDYILKSSKQISYWKYLYYKWF